MLQAIRSKTASIVVKALAGLLIISFAAWGIQDIIGTSASELTVASVGEHEIDPQEFEYELGRETQRLRQTFGGQLTEEQLVGLGIGNAVLQRMINDAVLGEEAKKVGILVSDDQVTRAIHRDAAFHGFDGNFSRNRFNEVMRANGFPEQVYIERVRADIALRQMLGVVNDAPAAPKKLTEMLRAYRFEKRSAETLMIRAADQPDPGTPDEIQLKAVYDAQSQRFTAPEYRKVTYVHLDPKLLMDDIAATPEEIQAAYDANAQNYVKAEQRTVQQIVLTDEAKANEAGRMLAEGQDFMKVATEFAEMEPAAVNLGSLTREGLLPDLAKTVFAIDEGSYVGPVKSPLGWHIFKVTEIDAGFVKSVDEVKDELTQIVKRERAIDALYDLSVRFEDQIGGGATLEEAGASVGAPAVTVASVDRDGKSPSGEDASGLPQLASLLPVAFAADEAIESDLTEAGDNGFFMVRVDAITPPTLKPMDKVRSEVADAWKVQEQIKAAEKQAKELAQLIDGGTSFASLGETVPGAIETVGPISRSDRDQASVSVIAKMFELQPNKAGIARIGNDYAVVHLRDVVAAGAGDDAPSVAELNTRLDQDVSLDLSAQIIEAMRAELGVTVNQRVFDAVLAPGSFDPLQPL